MRSTEDWSRLGGILIAALALAMLVGVGPRVLGLAAGPEAEIITSLKRLERDGFSLALAGAAAPLTSRGLQYQHLSVRLEPGAQRAEVLATLDFTGSLGDTHVSSLGVERVPFILRNGNWVPEGPPAPRLAAVVAALEARRRALDAGKPEELPQLPVSESGDGGPVEVGVGEPDLDTVRALKQRRYRAEAWFIRLEREEAAATEHWHLEGDLPSRPVVRRGASRLSLSRRGEEFLFPAVLR